MSVYELVFRALEDARMSGHEMEALYLRCMIGLLTVEEAEMPACYFGAKIKR